MIQLYKAPCGNVAVEPVTSHGVSVLCHGVAVWCHSVAAVPPLVRENSVVHRNPVVNRLGGLSCASVLKLSSSVMKLVLDLSSVLKLLLRLCRFYLINMTRNAGVNPLRKSPWAL